ncbi:septum formation family protein [Nocardioides sp. GCM10027113]|uniref:septum formation family protein n=1 Tax=unclassified Nocardioides TaxID=2615069 RepID=UPI00360E70E6
MTPSLGTFSRALVTTAVALALALPTGGAVAGATEPEPDGPHYQQPTVGECRAYDYDAMYGNAETSAPVDCTESHTAVVVAVETVPADGKLSGASKDVERILAKSCYPAMWDRLGRSHAVISRSAYGLAFFLPTKQQRQHGARWVRCDLVLRGGAKIMPLPTEQGYLQGRLLTDDEARCLVNLRRGTMVTVCDRKHQYRASQTVTMPWSKEPSADKALRYANRKCRDARSTRGWYATWANGLTWKAGSRILVCYRATRV